MTLIDNSQTIKDISVIPIGRRDWGVTAFGRLVCTCSKAADAVMISDGLHAINSVVDLQNKNLLLQDTVVTLVKHRWPPLGLIIKWLGR